MVMVVDYALLHLSTGPGEKDVANEGSKVRNIVSKKGRKVCPNIIVEGSGDTATATNARTGKKIERSRNVVRSDVEGEGRKESETSC